MTTELENSQLDPESLMKSIQYSIVFSICINGVVLPTIMFEVLLNKKVPELPIGIQVLLKLFVLKYINIISESIGMVNLAYS